MPGANLDKAPTYLAASLSYEAIVAPFPSAHGYWSMKLPCVQFADDLPKLDAYTRERDGAFGYPVDR